MMAGDHDLVPSQRTVVLREIKRSSGLTVPALAVKLGMSYMGVKQHCLHLEKAGLLASRNHHVGNGRPHLVYRLTRKAQSLFARNDNSILLSILRQAVGLYGPNAAAKLIFLSFQERAAGYSAKISKAESLRDRMAALVRLREAEGCMSRMEGDFCMIEYHSPWRDLFEAYPEAGGMEEGMISKVLGAKVVRKLVESADHYEMRYEVIPGAKAL